MAKTETAKARTKSGRDVTLYGEVTEDGLQVRVWSKDYNYGFFNLSRFDGGSLTAASFRAFFAPKDER